MRIRPTSKVANLIIDGVTLYGKLREIRDRSAPDEETGKYLYGELATETGETWSVQFRSKELDSIAPLFTKQVAVIGQAHYFTARAPKIVAREIIPDQERDYLAAFDELEGCMPELANETIDSLMDEARGG